MARFSIVLLACLSVWTTAACFDHDVQDAERATPNEAQLLDLLTPPSDERVVVLHENQGVFLGTGEVVDIDPYAKVIATDVHLARGRCSFRLHQGVCAVTSDDTTDVFTDEACSAATSYAIGSPNLDETNQSQGVVLVLQAKDGARYRAEILEDVSSSSGELEVTLWIANLDDDA